jgi:hypothetical protein
VQILGRQVNSTEDFARLAVRAIRQVVGRGGGQAARVVLTGQIQEFRNACEAGDVEKAIKLRSLAQLDSGSFFDVIRRLVSLRRFEDAKRIYVPASPEMLHVFSGEFLKAGQADCAVDCMRWAFEASGRQQNYHEELIRTLVSVGRIKEANEVAASLDAAKIRETYPRVRFKDFTPEEKCTLVEVSHITLAMPESIVQLSRAVSYILQNNIPGALIECGVFAGGNAVVMLRTLLNAGVTNRDVYLYDTYEGMPKPEEIDVEYSHGPALETWKKFKKGDDKSEDSSGWVAYPLEGVKSRILALPYPAERIRFVKGMVENTIPDIAPEQIALLRLDTDFYRSTKHELHHLFPRLSRGGILIIDDYGAFQGARVATDEYFKENNIAFFLGRSDEHVRVGVRL